MAYACKPSQSDNNTPPFMAVPHLNICAHPSIQILDIVHDNEEWRIINFYHDVRDNTCLQALLDIDISATICYGS
jgi:hypothetical protein